MQTLLVIPLPELWRESFEIIKHINLVSQVDLSRAVTKPKVRPSMGSAHIDFVEWQEPDDGRVGQLSISAGVRNAVRNDRRALPFPLLQVRATPIRYNDYHKDFQNESHTEKYFNNPQEAFEVFLSLIIANSSTVQYDVRKVSSYGCRKDGSPIIRDHGKLTINALKN